MGKRTLLRAAIGCFAIAAGAASAQQPTLKAYVPNTDIQQDRPFWLMVEASGSTVETPQITQGEGVVINTSSPTMSTQFSMSGREQQLSIRLSFVSTPIRSGTVVIPPVRAKINGRMMETEPITLEVKPAPEGEQSESPVRVWVDSDRVGLGEPLWIYIQATGMEIDLPETIDLDWADIDPQTIRSTSYSVGRQGQRTIEKIGYKAIPKKVGEFTVPAVSVRVTGRVLQTVPIPITVHQPEPKVAERPGDPPPDAELTQDDLVFIKMDADKNTVYQGEPLLLTMQLWRIQNRRITSGPYRGALIYGPSTEGFFVRELDANQYEATRGPWSYDVTETVKLLYPTRAGVLTIGNWHWEGIALVNRQSIVQRDKLYYKFDAGPIDINVLPLPPAPNGFSGGVGQFQVAAETTPSIVMQGVPFKLLVTVDGFGNPDAVGDPKLPELPWATVLEPERLLTFRAADDEAQPRMVKHFSFSITPLRSGRMEIPEFPFVYFDPQGAKYVTKQIGPFSIDVIAADEESTYLLASPQIPTAERHVEILAEDIRPLMERPGSLAPHRGNSSLWLLSFIAPVIAYAGLAFVAMRTTRRRENVGWARSQQARSSGVRRLRDVTQAAEPADALYRALVAFVADALNLDAAGMTSADIDRELQSAGVAPEQREKTLQILRACERARYASQRLSDAEIGALISGAESCIEALDGITRKGHTR